MKFGASKVGLTRKLELGKKIWYKENFLVKVNLTYGELCPEVLKQYNSFGTKQGCLVIDNKSLSRYVTFGQKNE